MLAVKQLSALLGGILSKHRGDFYCLNCLHSFTTEKNLNCIKNYVKIKIFKNILMPSEDTKILEFNQFKKSDMQILNV